MKNYYRHGDISFHPVETLPSDAKKENHDKLIVAFGEATGHHHQLQSAVNLMTLADKRWVEITEPTELTHQEHHTLTIEPGLYEIVTEQTFDYFEQSIKKVVD